MNRTLLAGIMLTLGWFSGSGIYRNVSIIATDKTHIANYGVNITTPDLTTPVVKTSIINEGDKSTSPHQE